MERRDKKTEFTPEEFFSRVKEALEGYEVTLYTECADKIIYTAKTIPQDTFTDDRELKSYSLDMKIEAIYHPDHCSVMFDCSGHGEYFGVSGPFKTKEDLEKIEGCLGLRYLNRKQFEQLSLF